MPRDSVTIGCSPGAANIHQDIIRRITGRPVADDRRGDPLAQETEPVRHPGCHAPPKPANTPESNMQLYR
jgi:hypothetical protein